jgi:hypothetical protein
MEKQEFGPATIEQTVHLSSLNISAFTSCSSGAQRVPSEGVHTSE